MDSLIVVCTGISRAGDQVLQVWNGLNYYKKMDQAYKTLVL